VGEFIYAHVIKYEMTNKLVYV